MLVRPFLLLLLLPLFVADISQARLNSNQISPTEETQPPKELPSTFGGNIQTANMFGALQRFLPTSQSPEERSKSIIGLLKLPSEGECTASLVGDDLILTAAHCISNSSDSAPENGNFIFYLQYKNGDYAEKVSAEPLTWGSFKLRDFPRDWALLRLNKPLGREYGYFGIALPRSSNKPLHLAGYGDAFGFGLQLSMANSCHFQPHVDDTIWLAHDCDSSSMDSGAPLFICEGSGCNIIAIHMGESRQGSTNSVHRSTYSHDYYNAAVSARQFIDAIKKYR